MTREIVGVEVVASQSAMANWWLVLILAASLRISPSRTPN